MTAYTAEQAVINLIEKARNIQAARYQDQKARRQYPWWECITAVHTHYCERQQGLVISDSEAGTLIRTTAIPRQQSEFKVKPLQS